MDKIFFTLIFTFLISFGVVAKTIDQKKEELKKIYEAGGISKVEYEKSIEYLENPKKEESVNLNSIQDLGHNILSNTMTQIEKFLNDKT